MTREMGKLRAWAVVISTVLVALLMIVCPGRAHAVSDDDPNLSGISRTVWGDCYIGEAWMVGSQSYFTVPTMNGGLSGSWPVTSWECINHTAAEPEDTWASYEGTLVNYSVDEGWLEYYVVITPPDATDGVTRNELGLIGYQRVAGYVHVAHEFNGKLVVQVGSARPLISDSNGCYTLAGATYRVYGDNSLSDVKGDVTTGDDGKTGELTLRKGTYYVKMANPSGGYLTDGELYAIEVSAGSTVMLGVTEMPANDPSGIVVQKADASIAAAVSTGDASLAQVEYVYAFYAGYYGGVGQAGLPGVPDRTWTVRANAAGMANIANAAQFVSGSSRYTNADGTVTLPLGTVTVTESKAPSGYILGTPKTYISHVRYDSDTSIGAVVVPVNY